MEIPHPRFCSAPLQTAADSCWTAEAIHLQSCIIWKVLWDPLSWKVVNYDDLWHWKQIWALTVWRTYLMCNPFLVHWKVPKYKKKIILVVPYELGPQLCQTEYHWLFELEQELREHLEWGVCFVAAPSSVSIRDVSLYPGCRFGHPNSSFLLTSHPWSPQYLFLLSVPSPPCCFCLQKQAFIILSLGSTYCN